MVDFRFSSRVNSGTPEEIRRAQALEKVKSAVYNKLEGASESDKLNLSSKARLMQSLKTAYDKLPGNDAKVAEVAQKAASQGENGGFNSEEIADAMLQGTLFDTI